MSATAKRLLHGNIASWAQIGVTLIAQIAMVPLFIGHWDKTTYGVWVGIQSLITMITIPDFGFQEYLQNEFLRFGDRRSRARRLLWSTLPVGLVVGAAEILVVAFAVFLGLHVTLLAIPTARIGSLGPAALLTLFSYLLATWVFGSVTGIAARAMSAYGYYARMSWWNVLFAVATSFLPAIVVASGGGFYAAGVTQCLAIVAVDVPRTVDMVRILRKERLGPMRPNLRYGVRMLGLSQALSLRAGIDRMRQQGIRLVLAPMIGASTLADFVTMRTAANVAFQSLGTVTGPMLPELMRYVHRRDQDRVEMAFGTVWLVVLAVLAPGTILLQAVAPGLFHVWTRGKIAYDAPTFGMLSLTVLVVAMVQPAASIAKGNNLLKIQLTMSAVATAITVGLTLLLVPFWGLRGASLALLLAETAVGAIAVGNANAWMRANGLAWPWVSLGRVTMAMLATALFVALCSAFPSHAFLVALVGILAQFAFVALYWRSLPGLARNRAADLIDAKLPKRIGSRLARALR